MAKRRVPTPPQLPVETFWWHDAASVDREVIDIEPTIVVRTGMVLHENAIEIVLVSEVESVPDYNNQNHSGFKIPRGLVIKRVRHGLIDVVVPEVSAYRERINEDPPEGDGDEKKG